MSASPTTTDCLIIGAGLAGLLAAQQIQAAGYQLLLVDKSRGVGGRLATRRATVTDADGSTSTVHFDHGAQYFTARSQTFQTIVAAWQQAGVVKQWSEGFRTSLGPKVDGTPRYVGVDGMKGIAKHLAANLDVRRQTHVAALRWDRTHWVATTQADDVFHAPVVLMTPPAPQTLAILAAGAVDLPASVATALSRIQFDPCFALMLALDGPSGIASPGGLWPNQGNIAWIADNQQKGTAAQPSVTVHATAEFTREYFDADRDSVRDMLMAEAQTYLSSQPILTQLHRWRYSVPTQFHHSPYLSSMAPGPIYFAGDAFAGPRVEGAALSGLEVAESMLALMAAQ